MLAAFREIHDGRWQRNVGTNGGRTLTWEGRIAIIGAVTTAWDRAHDVIASLGDRFVVLRLDSTQHRVAAGRRAIKNTGDEVARRGDLATVVADVLDGVRSDVGIALTDAERDGILAAADVVTLARTGVDYDYRGDVIDAHAPEMPTRLAKQLAQVLRGAVAIGMDRRAALGDVVVARVCGGDRRHPHPDARPARERNRGAGGIHSRPDAPRPALGGCA